jgi:hypothetical protein
LIKGLSEDGGFKEHYLYQEYRSKFLDSSVTHPKVRRQAAIDKFMAVEERNRDTNQRLYIGDTDFGWITSEELIFKARQIIRDIIGARPPEDLFSGGSHTFGASTRVRRSSQAAFLKHVGQAQGTYPALMHWCLAKSNTLVSDQELEVVESSVLFTVPKSSDIDRVACKEPEINMFLQRQAGSFIRKRLKKRAKINLNDQSINQTLAKHALQLDLATIDLSSASDSISRQLVLNLLPWDWYSLLDDLRVHTTNVDGTIHQLEMFSSMGNGFTFELESLLFYALTRASAWASGIKGTISVYGDDIIAPRKLARRLARVFHWFGFKVNPKKSNWSGKFRESCGHHFYDSREVTPFYLRGPIRKVSEVIRILNRLLVWDGRGYGFFITERAALFHQKWKGIIPLAVHGGQNPDRIDALVTGTPPRSRLIWKPKPLLREEYGAYVYWHTVRCSPIDEWVDRDSLGLDPTQGGRATIVPQSEWLDRTTWTPYTIYGACACDDPPK